MTQPEQEAREVLAACPFCGGEAEYVANTSSPLDPMSMAQCVICGALAYWRKWNTRVAFARPTAGIDRAAISQTNEDMIFMAHMRGRIDGYIHQLSHEITDAILRLLPAAAKTGERGAVIEECARVAESVGHFEYIRVEGDEWHPGSPYDRGQQDRAIAIAKAIRALSQPLPDAPIVGGEGEKL